jgi:glutamate racemase
MAEQQQIKTLKKIGVVDSGLGGLTVLRTLITAFPAHYFYLADTKNLPYGEKTEEQLIRISHMAVDFLIAHNVDAIIIACHTLSALGLEKVKSLYKNILFIGMIDAVVKQACTITQSGNIGIIATVPTIKSHAHQKEILRREPTCKVFEQPCPGLVPAIEKLPIDWGMIDTCLDTYFKILLENNIDTLILGCTHYSIIKDRIAQKIPLVKLVSSDEEIEKFFNAQDVPRNSFYSTVSFFVSGDEKDFFSKLPFYFDGELLKMLT